MKNSLSQFACILLIILMALSYLVGIRTLVVMSGSMEPEIPTGSLCFLDSKAGLKDVKEGDIITYSLLDSYITHRAVNISEAGIETKGDANSTKDFGIVTEENMEGRILGHIPYVGYVLYFIKKHIEVFMMAAMVMLLPYRKMFKGRRLNVDEKESISGYSDCSINPK